MKSISVLLAEDQFIFANGLKRLICRSPVVADFRHALNGKETLELLEKEISDLILLDIEMPVMNGIDTLRHVKKRYPLIKVVALTTFSDEASLLQLYELGIDGFLHKTIGLEEIERCISDVFSGNRHFNNWAENVIKTREARKISTLFSEKELRILRYMCMEKSVEDIATEIDLSISSVKKYRMTIYEKTNTESLAGLVKYAVRNKLINP